MSDGSKLVPKQSENFSAWANVKEMREGFGLYGNDRGSEGGKGKEEEDSVEVVARKVLQTGKKTRYSQLRAQWNENQNGQGEVLSDSEDEFLALMSILDADTFAGTDPTDLDPLFADDAPSRSLEFADHSAHRVLGRGKEIKGSKIEFTDSDVLMINEKSDQLEESVGTPQSRWKVFGKALIVLGVLVGIGVIAYNFEAIRGSVTHGHHVGGGHAGNGPPIYNKPPVDTLPPIQHPGGGGGFGNHHGVWSWGQRQT